MTDSIKRFALSRRNFLTRSALTLGAAATANPMLTAFASSTSPSGGTTALTRVSASQTVVSQVVTTPQGKTYLEVDGNPYLYLSVENFGQEQILGDSVNPGGSDWRYNTHLFSTPLPRSWLENVFEKTKAAGYTTISMILKWNEIETTQGGFDWTLVDQYIGWANQYDLRIDWVWWGAMCDSGTRFPGQTNGWMCWVPPYVQDLNTYFGNGVYTGDIFSCWLPDGGTHSADAQFLFDAERNAVAQLFAHLAAYDTNHRTILFQAMNEPNLHPQWGSEQSVIIGLVSQMAQVIKNSDYVVATRVNYSGGGGPNIPSIDFVGADPYTTSVNSITSLITQSGSAIPSIAENDGSYSNISTLATATLVNGGLYNSFQLNDHFPPQGIYDASAAYYANWTIGTIPPLRHGGLAMQRLLTSLNKIGPLVATAPKTQTNGFNIETDTPAQSYNSFKTVGNYTIGFASSDGSVGMAVNQGSYVYCSSDTGGSVTFQTQMQPVVATIGHLDSNGNWAVDETRSYTNNGDGTYSITYNTTETLRLELPAASPLQQFVGYWTFDEGSGSTAADSSGNGQTGTLINNPTWVSGKLNSALSFNGTNTYISANWGILDGNAARTIALWFKTTSTANSNWVSWGTNASNQLSQVGIYNGGLGYLGYGNDLTAPAASYADGNWHHLAVTFDGGNSLILYLDGVQVNAETTTLATGTSQLNIGRAITGANYYNGVLDEVRIYNYALSAADVSNLDSLVPLIVGYWKFDEDSGSTAVDSSGNGRTGTLINNPTWVSGKLNSALSFNGVNAYVSIPWSILSGNAARTIALWFKTTSTANSNWVSWGTNVSNQLSQVGIYNGGLGYLGYANDLTAPATSYADGNWHHLAVTFNGTTMILYLDGVQVNTETTTLATGTSALNIGSAITGSGYYNGALDEVHIYSEALSASQINQLYTLS